MGIEFIKETLKKNSNANIAAGIFVALVGLGLIILFASDAGPEDDLSPAGKISLVVLFGLFMALGIGLVIYGFVIRSSAKNGKHKVIQALENNDQDFIIWIYENIVTNRGNKSHHIIAYGRNKKGYRFGMKNEEQAKDLFVYLAGKFPHAEMGYSPEIEQQMKTKFGIRKRF